MPGDLIFFHDLIQKNGAWKMVSTAGVWTQDLSVMSLLPYHKTTATPWIQSIFIFCELERHSLLIIIFWTMQQKKSKMFK
jgi:hypothetical protein